MGYYGGISNAFSDLTEFDAYLLQAEYTVSRGNRSGKALYYFHDCVLSYMLDACCRDLGADALIGQGMKNLLSYDKSRSAEYVRTLELYLKNECSIARTAEELFIHRSSLIKRLDKIKKILRDDLEDSNHRLYYRLCLELMKRE